MLKQKWDVEEIEDLRVQINELQQKNEYYQGVIPMIKSLLWVLFGLLKQLPLKIRNNIDRRRGSPNLVPDIPDFLVKNPDFKPYNIRLRPLNESKMLPKILHVIPTFITGGSQQLIVDLIEGLSDSYTHEIAVADVSAEYGYSGVVVHDFSRASTISSFLDKLKHIKPDIVHVHYWGKWKGAYELWKWYHRAFQASFAYGCKVLENCNIPSMGYFNKGISKYIYVSEYAKDTFGIRNLPNIVVYPGSNFSFFQRTSEPDPDTVGMVYRLDQDKLDELSIDTLIRAVQKRPNTKAIVVGGGFYLELYKRKVASAGLEKSFTFTGYVAYEKLYEYYQKLSVFVAPVHSESFGQVTPFAMSMEIPVVAYNVGALDEILGQSTMLAAPQDVEKISDIIIKVLNDKNIGFNIGRFNKERANKYFSVQTTVESYGKIYDNVLLT